MFAIWHYSFISVTSLFKLWYKSCFPQGNPTYTLIKWVQPSLPAGLSRATLLQAERRGDLRLPGSSTPHPWHKEPRLLETSCLTGSKLKHLIQGLQPWTWRWSHWVTLFNKEEAIKIPERPPSVFLPQCWGGRDLSEWCPQGKAFPVSSQMVTDKTSPSYLHWPQNYQNLSCGLEMAQQFKSACSSFRGQPAWFPASTSRASQQPITLAPGDLRPSPGHTHVA